MANTITVRKLPHIDGKPDRWACFFNQEGHALSSSHNTKEEAIADARGLLARDPYRRIVVEGEPDSAPCICAHVEHRGFCLFLGCQCRGYEPAMGRL